ncbi:MAG TPA: FAD-dependent oxidoreductase [Armatimonadota bacterium]|nr:FAD-dependent oxidoreductase [Armatimonadota bacterium]
MPPAPTIHQAAREIPVCHECDVCVIGGSCTGVFAAVRAARLGARVAIVERQNCFGGVATCGLVNVWHRLHDTQNELQIIGGMTEEIIDRLRRRGAVEQDPGSVSSAFRLNTEELKLELDELICAAGVRPFLHALATTAHTEDGRLDAVITESKSGCRAIRARVFIDATGDGDIVARAGVETWSAPHPQPATAAARFAGWDMPAGFRLGAALREHGPALGLPEGFVWGARVPGTDEYMLAGTRVYELDPTDADSLTEAEMEGRRQVRAVVEALRQAGVDDPPALTALPSALGLRESRHIVARYRLTGDDVLRGRRFPDAIANGTYPADVHHHDRPGITFRHLDGTEVISRPGHPQEHGRWRDPSDVDPTFYQVPYDSLVPHDAGNVLATGRILDADEVAFGAVRVMVNCNQMGEAAGVGAYLALEGGTSVGDVDTAALRRALADGGSIVL